LGLFLKKTMNTHPKPWGWKQGETKRGDNMRTTGLKIR